VILELQEAFEFLTSALDESLVTRWQRLELRVIECDELAQIVAFNQPMKGGLGGERKRLKIRK